MQFLPWTTFAAAIVGDDLHTAVVSGSLLGVRARHGPVLREFLGMPAEEARRMLGNLPDSARPMLVVPGTMAGVRPTALPPAKWAAARTEITRSVESLFPIRAEDAALGYIGRRLPDGGEAGYLIAADRHALKPWIDALARVLGRPVDTVVSSHMALPGLGLQSEPESEVAESSGSNLSHRLAFGEVTELNAPRDERLAARLLLPGGAPPEPVPAEAKRVSGSDLAVAAAIAPRVAGGRISPLIGRPFAADRRWLPAAAVIAAAMLFIWLARWTESARYERGIARLDLERADRAALLEDARATRRRAMDLDARLRAVESARGPAASGMLPAVDAAQAVLPQGAFLYRVDVDPRAITIKGESARAGDVLRALEDAPEFQGARELDTPMTVEERGLEMFNIRADRVHASTGSAEGGAR